MARTIPTPTGPRSYSNPGKNDLVVVGAALSVGLVAFDIHSNQVPRAQAVKELGAVVLLWGLVFVLSEFSSGLGTSVAVFVLLIFLVARRGAVSALFSLYGGNAVSSAPQAFTPSTIATATPH